jgi:S1-C subfamily serine protease
MPTSLVDFSHELADTVESAGQSVISVLEGGRAGVSGTVWRKGIAITVAHTIHGLDDVTVILPSGIETKATVSARDSGTDIAILQLAPDVPPATQADDSRIRTGEIVLSIGRRGTDGLAAAYGIVSAISGSWRTTTGARVDRWLRLDLNPFPGFSGGPVVNAAGEVIGMATSGPGRSAAIVPTSTVNRVVDQLIKHGHIVRGYIGVGLQPVAFPDDAWQLLGINSGRGLLITAIAPGSAAAEAKLTLGDVIVTIDGKPLRSGVGLQSLLDAETVGKSVSIGVVRGGQLLNVPVTVRERTPTERPR